MTEKLMRSISIGSDLGIKIVETPAPMPLDDEIIVAPIAGGICGTDLHIVKGEFPQALFPVVPCHEFSGTVVAVGRNVIRFREGDLVTADPNVSCGACRWCLMSRPNLCVRLAVIGVTRPGAAAELVAVPARCSHLLPKSVTPDLGAMIEPLACACNAVDRAGNLRGRRILVMGSGVMGLLITIVAGRMNAGEIWVSDPSEAKHGIARLVGAAHTVTPQQLEGERFDIVFEASGAPPATKQVMALLNPTGIWMQVGVLAPETSVAIRPFDVFDRELSIIGSNSLADKFPNAVELMPDIIEQAKHLITGKVSVWSFDSALASARSMTSVKTQLFF